MQEVVIEDCHFIGPSDIENRAIVRVSHKYGNHCIGGDGRLAGHIDLDEKIFVMQGVVVLCGEPARKFLARRARIDWWVGVWRRAVWPLSAPVRWWNGRSRP